MPSLDLDGDDRNTSKNPFRTTRSHFQPTRGDDLLTGSSDSRCTAGMFDLNCCRACLRLASAPAGLVQWDGARMNPRCQC